MVTIGCSLLTGVLLAAGDAWRLSVKVGDLVEYAYGKQRELGTVLRLDPEFRSEECYIVWHTTDNEGWWNKRIMKVVSKHESR